jgi:hypothetical protein
MTDTEIIAALVLASQEGGAVDVANLLDGLTNGGLNQGAMIMYFKRSFPEIPLRVLIDASGWSRLTNGGLSDQEFDAALRPWLPTTSAHS